MVTKHETLKKLKLLQLKEAAKELGLEPKGKKEELVEQISAKLKKEDLLDLLSKLTIPKPQFELFKHKLVPMHEILSENEVKSLLEKYKCAVSQLPKVKFTDPAVKVLGAKPGDVVKITRTSPTAGKATYYRVVVR